MPRVREVRPQARGAVFSPSVRVCVECEIQVQAQIGVQFVREGEAARDYKEEWRGVPVFSDSDV